MIKDAIGIVLVSDKVSGLAIGSNILSLISQILVLSHLLLTSRNIGIELDSMGLSI